MSAFINLVNQQFGRLMVIDLASMDGGATRWQCRCECGAIVVVKSGDLRNGHTRSCGCYQRQRASQTMTRHGESKSTPEYRAWLNMRTRCSNSRLVYFKYYGGRGIEVCERWHVFENFLADMGRRPTAKHSIDRINPDGHYEPGNCRWATWPEQSNNQRRHKKDQVNDRHDT